jgi:hypothetical protein
VSHFAKSLLIFSIILILYGLPLVSNLVPRNRWFGITIPAAMKGTKADWYTINRKGGLTFLTLGLIALVVSLVLSHFAL